MTITKKSIDQLLGNTPQELTEARVKGKNAILSQDPIRILEGYQALNNKPMAQQAYIDGARQTAKETGYDIQI